MPERDFQLSIRVAQPADIEMLRALSSSAIEILQRDFLNEAQIAASHSVMGVDTQLIEDGTYLIAEHDAMAVGCGGWSWRATLYGGDSSIAPRDAAPLDPSKDPARIRAMYTRPGFERRGIGRAVLHACFAAARLKGFASVELMATMSGVPLYMAEGFIAVEGVRPHLVGEVPVPLVRMRRTL